MTSAFSLLKSAVFTVLVPGTVVGLIPWILARYDRRSPTLGSPAARLVGRLALVSGALLYVYTATRFLAEGDGTSSPTDESDELVTGASTGTLGTRCTSASSC